MNTYQTILKRYIVFSHGCYKNGGLQDVAGSFDNLDDATKLVEQEEDKTSNDVYVFDRIEGSIIK
jgi:hypothetical protein